VQPEIKLCVASAIVIESIDYEIPNKLRYYLELEIEMNMSSQKSRRSDKIKIEFPFTDQVILFTCNLCDI